MSEWLAQTISVLFLALVQMRFPALSPATAMPWQRAEDPSYAVYQRYRYAYDTYGYLFLSSGTDETDENQDREGKKTGDLDEIYQTNQTDQEAAQSGLDKSEQPEQYGQSEGNQEKRQEENEDREESQILDGPERTEEREQRVQSAREVLADYETLMENFYIVHSSTVASPELMNVNTFLDTDLTLKQDRSVPQILIYHTHSQETYQDFGPGNPSARVTAVGEILAELLREKGWNVIHDTTPYDMEGGSLDRSRAYTYALEGISRILEEYPTIQVVLDVHRDGVADHIHLVSEIDGKPTANVMLFQGMSQTQDGPISYLPNPYLKENLAFSFQLQLMAAQRAPGFMRKIYLKSLRYNLHVRQRSALIEVGAQTNTGEEAENAMRPLAEVLDMVLQGK